MSRKWRVINTDMRIEAWCVRRGTRILREAVHVDIAHGNCLIWAVMCGACSLEKLG
jgi:hypothetical protein